MRELCRWESKLACELLVSKILQMYHELSREGEGGKKGGREGGREGLRREGGKSQSTRADGWSKYEDFIIPPPHLLALHNFMSYIVLSSLQCNIVTKWL